MALSSIAVSVDRSNYSRYDDKARVITATANFSAASGGEQVSFVLQRLMQKKTGHDWASMGVPTVVTLSNGNTTANVAFDLFFDSDLFDVSGYMTTRHSIRENDWRVLVTSGSVSTNATFSVLVIALENFKSQYLFGLPLISIENLEIAQQPQVIVGVTVNSVSFGSAIGPGALSFKPASLVPPNGAIYWRAGAPTPILAGVHTYNLADGLTGSINVTIDSSALPSVSGLTQETLLVDYGLMSDSAIIRMIITATDKIESLLYVPIEPKLIVAQPTADWDTAAPAFYDEKVPAVTYFRPTNFNQWLHIETPYPGILRIDKLSGYMNRTKSVDIDSGWISAQSMSGKIDLVPSDSVVLNWFFYGQGLYSIFYNSTSVPNFWSFIMLNGLPDCPEDVRDYIASVAAMAVLAQAAMARYPAGVTSYSISRDGVSESRSLLPGIYLQYIQNYERMLGRDDRGIDSRLTTLRERYVGLLSVVL